MKRSNNSRHTRRRPLKTVVILLILAIAGVLFAKLLFDSSAKNSTESSTDNSTTFSTNPVENSSASSNTSSSGELPKKKEVEKYDGSNPNDSPSLTGAINTARISGEMLIIRVSIDQYLSSGDCSLSLTSENDVFESSSPIISDVSTSTCEGFDIPVSSLKSGNYSININLSSGEKFGVIMGEVSL